MKIKSSVKGLLLSFLLLGLPAGAASISDFTLSSNLGFGGTQELFSLVQVNPEPSPTSPALAGVDIGLLVSFGSATNATGTVTNGMFFEFVNFSGAPNQNSILTSIKFQTSGLLNNPSYVGWSGTKVGYTIGGNVPNGGFSIDFNDSLNADANNPQPQWGVGLGEHLIIGYTIDTANGHTYQSLLKDLIDGGPENYKGWTIGAHLQNTTGNANSIWLASFSENQGTTPQDPGPNPVVPVPAAAGLGMLGLAVVGIVRRRR